MRGEKPCRGLVDLFSGQRGRSICRRRPDHIQQTLLAIEDVAGGDDRLLSPILAATYHRFPSENSPDRLMARAMHCHHLARTAITVEAGEALIWLAIRFVTLATKRKAQAIPRDGRGRAPSNGAISSANRGHERGRRPGQFRRPAQFGALRHCRVRPITLA
jgi:hypothetical protein